MCPKHLRTFKVVHPNGAMDSLLSAATRAGQCASLRTVERVTMHKTSLIPSHEAPPTAWRKPREPGFLEQAAG